MRDSAHLIRCFISISNLVKDDLRNYVPEAFNSWELTLGWDTRDVNVGLSFATPGYVQLEHLLKFTSSVPSTKPAVLKNVF